MRRSTMMMLALASSTLAATPAAATTDNAGYVGIEAGLWFPTDVDADIDSDDSFTSSYEYDLQMDMGFDGDIIGGYDFGQFRLEAELAYKTAGIDNIDVSSDCCDFEVDDVDADLSVWSLMGNALWNPTIGDRWDVYLGGGIGWAWSKFDADDLGSAKDNAFAWQLIAGVGYQISDNIELGLKYRYFSTDFGDDFEVDGDDAEIEGDIRSHSILASLIFSFGSAPPPPPPPPPPPEPERG